jgi:hypothetical protein
MKYRDMTSLAPVLVDAEMFVFDWLGDQPLPKRYPNGDTDVTLSFFGGTFNPTMQQGSGGYFLRLPNGIPVSQGNYLIRMEDGTITACSVPAFRRLYQEASS